MSRTFYEKGAFSKGYRYVAGVDEAGRGPLAGPVVAAACILPTSFTIEGINDSKQLTFKQRDALYHMLRAYPGVMFGVGVVDEGMIDRMNILKASLYAMDLAIQSLSKEPDYLLVDGTYLPNSSIPGEAIVKGDSHSLSIGAASIIAKYERDRLMIEYHKQFPCYGFDQNKGYGTKAHLKALATHGPCPIHRKSFAPLKSFVPLNACPLTGSLI